MLRRRGIQPLVVVAALAVGGSVLQAGFTDQTALKGVVTIAGGGNHPPVANAGDDKSTAEGALVTLSPNDSSDPDGDALTYAWTQLPGSPAVTLTTHLDKTVTFTPPDGEATPTAYTFRLTATDPSGASSTDDVVVSVSNVAPSPQEIGGLPDDPIPTGVTITPWAGFDDPGLIDTHTAVWDWGDNTTSAGTVVDHQVSGIHSYASPGSYTIKLTVTDKDGGSGSITTTEQVVVVNPPVCTYTVEEPTRSHPEYATARCRLTVTNMSLKPVPLDVRLRTSSLSNNDKPVAYYNGSPTDIPPKPDARKGIPDYSENLLITDSRTATRYDFGALSCPPVKKPAKYATCSSGPKVTPNALTLASGQSVTFTVTVHLNHGGHDGSTIRVYLDALVGGTNDVFGTLPALFYVS